MKDAGSDMMTAKRLTDERICKDITEAVEEMIEENDLSLVELALRIDEITDRLYELENELDKLQTELINKQGLLIALVYKK